MPYEVQMNEKTIGVYDPKSRQISYDKVQVDAVVKEIIAGQTSAGGNAKSTVLMMRTPRVVYTFDKNRINNNDAVYLAWKSNPIVQNRVLQLNALVFGNNMKCSYKDKVIQDLVDQFWRINRVNELLRPMCTDAQLYGEIFVGLFPQKTGQVLMSVYTANQCEVNFNPQNCNDIESYIITYKDEKASKDQVIEFYPLYKLLNDVEFGTGNSARTTKNVMIHIKFNNGSSDVYGTSDFRQVYGALQDYMDFISDRLTIQQLYGSPSYDISIETDDPNVITKRIEELAQFVIGSNPVHNDKEKWTPMEFKHNAGTSAHDDKALRGLIAAGMGFPEHMLFNQSTESNNGRESEAGQYSLYQLAMSKQSAFSDLFKNIHKFVAITAGKDPLSVDDGQLVFPEISTMSEKTKAETYALKVGAKICSRKTAALNTGHNWEIEQQQIQDEMAIFGDPGNDPTMAGVVGGRMSTRANNSDPNRDTGADDKGARSDPTNVRGNQTFGDHKASN